MIKIKLKGYSGVSSIHSLTHLDTEYDPPPPPLRAYIVLAYKSPLETGSKHIFQGIKHLILLPALSENLAIYTWIHLLQCIVVVRLILRMLKLRKLAVRKLHLSRGGRTQCQVVLEHGLNLHQNIPLNCSLYGGWDVTAPTLNHIVF